MSFTQYLIPLSLIIRFFFSFLYLPQNATSLNIDTYVKSYGRLGTFDDIQLEPHYKIIITLKLTLSYNFHSKRIKGDKSLFVINNWLFIGVI